MFEIHLSVDQCQEIFVKSLIDDISVKFKKIYNLKIMATLTSTGILKRQPMITGYINSLNREEVFIITQALIAYLDCLNVKVSRTKIEKLITLDNADKLLQDEYYEAHIKITLESSEDYEKLARLSLRHGVQLLINPYSLKVSPVTTMRMYDTDFETFKRAHLAFLQELEFNKFLIFKVHIEHGVLDSNILHDQGWLFKDDYKVPITTLDTLERLKCPL